MSVLNDLKKIFTLAVKAAYPELEIERGMIDVVGVTQKSFGHYQFNSAMKLARPLRENPRQIATKILDSVKGLPENRHFKSLEIAGPGFINIHLTDQYLESFLKLTLPSIEIDQVGKGQKVVVDFSSPNTAKEMHVGHLRSTIIGDSIAHVLAACGYEVLRLNHIGDWGTAFGMLIAYMKSFVSKDERASAELSTLVSWYKKSKELFDSDSEFKKLSQSEVVELQGGNIDSLDRWKEICSISRRAYQEIYDLLRVELIERGESYYNPMLSSVVKEFEEKGLVTVSDGAKCVYLEGYKNRDGDPLPFMIQKSDGGFNYASTDIAALKQRIGQEKADRIVYVTDAGQATHFSMLFDATEKAKIWDVECHRLDHVPFGLVLGEDGKKFKTRSGEVERLKDLIDRALEKAEQLIQDREHIQALPKEEQKSLVHALAINSIKYADLSCNRISDYKFSYDRMLRFEGNTAPFLMYAYVRIQGIKRKASTEVLEKINVSDIAISHTSERDLILKIIQFNDVILQVADDLFPNRICEYLYDLAEHFNAFFRDCRVVGVEEEKSRLAICEACGSVLKKGMELLGLKVVERM